VCAFVYVNGSLISQVASTVSGKYIQNKERVRRLGFWREFVNFLSVPVTVHREQSVKKEYRQDATI